MPSISPEDFPTCSIKIKNKLVFQQENSELTKEVYTIIGNQENFPLCLGSLDRQIFLSYLRDNENRQTFPQATRKWTFVWLFKRTNKWWKI